MSVTLLLADDHPIVRQGLRHLLERESEFHIVGEAGDGVEALQLVELLKPDILVLDVMMPGLNGLEVLRQTRKISPSTHTIILTMQSADAYMIEALKIGAAGYLLKETGPGELVDAVHEVLKGNRFLSANFADRFQDDELKLGDIPSDAYRTLTAREREILQLTVEGLTSGEIGKKLRISPRTVEEHRSNLTNKLGIKHQTDLIRFAIKHGLLPMDG
ncbi:MAG TPA: response regulator transcription factor [Anaerolineales bacterium]|nr:response regulator transcription factor [Anaerolineales bacterium]